MVIARRPLLGGYALWWVVLILAYYGLPGLRPETWGLLGLSGVVAIVAGVFLNRPARRVPWLLLAAANLSFVAGQVSFLVFGQILREPLPFPSFADVLYLVTYPLYAIGLLIFIWSRAPDRDQRSVIDALTLTVGLALVSWMYLILPYVHNPQLSWLQKCVAIAYPLGDVLVLAMLARLLAPGTGRSRSVWLLTLGTVAMLVSDACFGGLQLYGSFHSGTVVDLGWAVFYGAWGAASLDSTMSEATEPAPRQQPQASTGRLIVLMLASLIAPIVLFIQSLRHHNYDGAVIAVFSAILFLLVISRLWDMAASHRRALGRERTVRVAGASLASAATVAQVAAAMQSAAADLTGSQSPGDALLMVRDDGSMRAITALPTPMSGPVTDVAGVASPDGAASPAGVAGLDELARLTENWLPLLTGAEPLFLPRTQLSAEASALLRWGDGVLLCPLTLRDRPAGDPLIGVLVVFGTRRILTDLSDTFEILAHQVALAVERIALSVEVIRQRSEAYFRTLVQDTSDVILIVTDDGLVRYATPSAASIFGPISTEGVHLWDLVALVERDDIIKALARLRRYVGHGSYTEDWHITRRDHRSVQVQVRCSDLRHDHTVSGLVLTLRDVTEQRQLEAELKHRAFHDALTGLPNRLLFQDRAAHALARAKREGTTTGVLFVDLDDFKVTNDTMGHGVGDELLVAAGIRLSAVVRETDTAARLGGDEFALLVEHLADPAAVEAFAERVVRAFSEAFDLADGSVLTTATVGVATTEDSADVDELLRHADLALYAAKSSGKRQWRRYAPVLSAGMIRRREVQAALEEAVNNSAFTLVYQPIVALTSGAIAGFEALVRWPHAQWGMMQPDQFIELAEETGHIVPLGSWVLGQAASEIVQWRPRSPGPLYASVNVSARQFRDPGFVDGVRRVLAQTGLASSSLMLELTESVLLRRDDRLLADLVELKAIGVKLAIDDFGTGYSSLSYLRELPIDVLKIDKSFVDGIAVSEQRLALVEGIIRIARTLRLDVIAEGIETEVQRDLLTSMGCHYGQGYLLAMPVAADQAEMLVRIGHGPVPELPRVSP
ncbi:MAG TPA: EAL domain-containing protein [Streptosporangiaceae bacterium]|nr:EAL domain-containing protein [Streptosporangiaceae bacterium]